MKVAYDESTAHRIRRTLKRRRGVTEQRMFGGIAFLLNGNMCCGVIDRDLVVRLGRDLASKALREPHTREMDFTGKPMKSMVYVGPAGYRTEASLKRWVNRAVDFVKTLPPKT